MAAPPSPAQARRGPARGPLPRTTLPPIASAHSSGAPASRRPNATASSRASTTAECFLDDQPVAGVNDRDGLEPPVARLRIRAVRRCAQPRWRRTAPATRTMRPGPPGWSGSAHQQPAVAGWRIVDLAHNRGPSDCSTLVSRADIARARSCSSSAATHCQARAQPAAKNPHPNLALIRRLVLRLFRIPHRMLVPRFTASCY